MMTKFQPLLIVTLLLLLQPISVYPNCICSELENTEQNKSNDAVRYKLIAIASILLSSGLGICIPLLAKNTSALRQENNVYFLIKWFAAGVILATGFIHILPDAFASLTSPCIEHKPWGEFPFSGFVAMVAAIATMMMEAFATGYHKRAELRKARPVNGEDGLELEHGSHVHGSGFMVPQAGGDIDMGSSSELVRHRVIAQVLELGIVVHSVIIGITLGASKSSKTIKPLVAALSFHQFFEGMGLGGCIFQAKLKFGTSATMALFFSLTTPTGIAIGIGISRSYSDNSSTALIIQGILNSVSAGILIYMALVDLLAADFLSSKMQTNIRLQVGANLTLLLGASSMSLLAKWGGM